MTAPNRPPSPIQSLSRARLQTLLKTALTVGEARYAQRIALAWLSAFPGDLPVTLNYGRALLQDNRPDVHRQAFPLLERLCRLDPEYLETWEIQVSQHLSADANKDVASSCVRFAANCVALGGSYPNSRRLPPWATVLQKVRQRLVNGDLPAAERLLLPILATDALHSPISAENEASATPLVAISQLRLLAAQGHPAPVAHNLPDDHPKRNIPLALASPALLAIRNLAEAYHQRWPDCLVFTLYLADTLMETGQDDLGVALLHQTAVQDVTGQVITRLWGAHHPYRALWPATLEIEAFSPTPPQEIPIPAAVAAALGWNLLPQPSQLATPSGRDHPSTQLDPPVSDQPSSSSTSTPNLLGVKRGVTPSQRQSKTSLPEALRSVQTELERVAMRLKRPGLADNDGRFPVYVILTTRQGLLSQYGAEGAASLENEMVRLLTAIRADRGWDTRLFLADDPQCMAALGLQPVPHQDPWQLKLALADLDQALRQRGEMIGAVLIAGGPEVVPFHCLPNPVDDADMDVPSDNPYAARDENYFIPEWPVGRIPGGSGNDPGLLLNLLRQATTRHIAQAKRKPRWRWWDWVRRTLWPHRKTQSSSLGYTAAVWRRASLAVYRAIGEPRSLLISPPLEAESMSVEKPSRLGYFNLHGVIDAVEWFGQRDPTEPGDGPDYPVALRPQDVAGNSFTNVNGFVENPGKNNPVPESKYHASQIIFSEACYGAHIMGRTLDESLALKFLASGSLAMVGSTVTSYGSLTMPLIAADLLGRAFWHHLKEGYPAGDALRRAKISLAREMHHRQGYLDGEDQKTLISFVLYGDPLAQSLPLSHAPKAITRSIEPEAVKVVCDRGNSGQDAASQQPLPIPAETLAQVKRLVAHYLPGMNDADIRLVRNDSAVRHEPQNLPDPVNLKQPGNSDHHGLASQMDAKARPTHPPERKVVTLSKRVEQSMLTHNQIARLTLDNRGRLVKLAVSR